MSKIVLIDLYGVLFKNLFAKWLEDNKEILQQWLKKNSHNETFFNFDIKSNEIILSCHYPDYFKDLIQNNEQGNISNEIFYRILNDSAQNTTENDMYKLIHAKEGCLNLDIVNFIEQEKLNNNIICLVSHANQEIVEEFLSYEYDKIEHKLVKHLFSKVFLSQEIGHLLSSLEYFQNICTIMNCHLSDLYFVTHQEKEFYRSIEKSINLIFYNESIKLNSKIDNFSLT